MKEYGRYGGAVPLTGNISTKMRRVVSFTQWPLHTHRKCPCFPLSGMLDGADSRSVGFEGLNYCPAKNQTTILRSSSSKLETTLTAPSWATWSCLQLCPLFTQLFINSLELYVTHKPCGLIIE